MFVGVRVVRWGFEGMGERGELFRSLIIFFFLFRVFRIWVFFFFFAGICFG